MAITIHASGTRTAGTPPESAFTVLGNTNDANIGIYQVFLNTKNMLAGDEIDIQILETTISGGTQNVVYTATVTNAQIEPVWVSPSLILYHGWQVQLRQTLGTARSFDWSIRRVN